MRSSAQVKSQDQAAIRAKPALRKKTLVKRAHYIPISPNCFYKPQVATALTTRKLSLTPLGMTKATAKMAFAAW